MRKLALVLTFVIGGFLYVQKTIVANEKIAPLENRIFFDGKHAEAISLLEKQLAANRNDGEVKFYLAAAYVLSQTRLTDAVSLLHECLHANPANIRVSLLLAQAQASQAISESKAGSLIETGGVFDSFRAVLNKDPDNYDGLVSLALAQESLLSYDPDRIRPLLEQAIVARPHRILAYYHLARIVMKYDPDPLHAYAMEVLLKADAAMKRLRDSRKQILYVDNVAYGNVLLEKAKIYYQRLDLSSFATTIGKHVKTIPDSAEGWMYMGFAREISEDSDAALMAFQTALHLAESQGLTELASVVQGHIQRLKHA